MLDTHEYYCKVFVNKDIDHRELEVLIGKLISAKNEKRTKTASWGEIDVNINKAAKPPWGKVDDDNFLFWKFFLDIEPLENSTRDEYIKGIIHLMYSLRHNGFQVVAACDFENELPKFYNKNFELAYRIYPEPQGTNYYESDLIDENNVEILFDYCGILEAIIFKVGWEFLIEFYGYEKLFEINKKSGLFDAENIEEFLRYIEFNIGYCEGES